MSENDIDRQREMCRRFGVTPVESPEQMKVGIARNVAGGKLEPLNGMRVRPCGDTTGWFIWAGATWSDDTGFFVPLHVGHLSKWCPQAIPYLLLPIGWRFLLAPGQEDVWFDEQLARDER